MFILPDLFDQMWEIKLILLPLLTFLDNLVIFGLFPVLKPTVDGAKPKFETLFESPMNFLDIVSLAVIIIFMAIAAK